MNFKILDEFQHEMDEFYDENLVKEEEVQPIYSERHNEHCIEFFTQEETCSNCNVKTIFEVYRFRHKEERICSRCGLKQEKRI